jgi:hypothetical protein
MSTCVVLPDVTRTTPSFVFDVMVAGDFVSKAIFSDWTILNARPVMTDPLASSVEFSEVVTLDRSMELPSEFI